MLEKRTGISSIHPKVQISHQPGLLKGPGIAYLLSLLITKRLKITNLEIWTHSRVRTFRQQISILDLQSILQSASVHQVLPNP